MMIELFLRSLAGLGIGAVIAVAALFVMLFARVWFDEFRSWLLAKILK